MQKFVHDQTVLFSKPCSCPAQNFGMAFELSVPIPYPLPSLMLRRAVSFEYHSVTTVSFPAPETTALEAQQRYFSYRAKLVAIVSQFFFVLVFVGYRTIIARYVAKWGIAQMCLCETMCQEGVSHQRIARYGVSQR